MPLNETISLYTDAACENLMLEDTTVYGVGGNPASSTITGSVIIVTYTLLGTTVTYTLTVVTNVVTAATMTLGAAAPVDILSNLASTVFPFTSANPFSLTDTDYHATMPQFQDQVYDVTYNITGTAGLNETTTGVILTTCTTSCCIADKLRKADINNTDKLVDNLVPTAYLELAEAFKVTNRPKANTYVQRAYSICSGDCNCC